MSRNSRSNPRWACVLFGLISCWKLSKTGHYNSSAFLSSGDLQVNSLVAPGLWSALWLLFFWICILIKLRLFHILASGDSIFFFCSCSREIMLVSGDLFHLWLVSRGLLQLGWLCKRSLDYDVFSIQAIFVYFILSVVRRKNR